MRRWTEHERLKNYREKISRAKAIVNSHIPLPSIRVSAPSIQTQSDLPSDSLGAYLRMYHLQQYQRKLAEEGYEEDVLRLVSLPPGDREALVERLKLLPGHRQKFAAMLEELRRMSAALSHRKPKNRTAGKSVSPVVVSPVDFSKSAERTVCGLPKSSNFALYAELAEAKTKIQQLESQVSAQIPRIHAETPVFSTKKPRQKAESSGLNRSFDEEAAKAVMGSENIEELSRGLARAVKEKLRESRRYQEAEEIGRVFEQEGEEMPQEKDVYNFVKNAFVRTRSPPEAVLAVYLYIEQLVEKTNICLSQKTWKKLTLTALVLACKVMDASVTTSAFSSLFPLYSAASLETMEQTLLLSLNFHVSLSAALLAQGYFRLRTFCQSPSAPVRTLNRSAFVVFERNSERMQTRLERGGTRL